MAARSQLAVPADSRAGSVADPQVADLVQTIAPRREPLDQAQAKIHDFAQHLGEQKQAKLLALLAGLFTVLDQERGSVMSGLDRFGARQKQLAAEIRGDETKLWHDQNDPKADATAVNHLTEQVKWEFQVFQDRRQAISYACDVPSKIEQRLFALARDIQQELG
jgi:predicted  nucleic acid-binding Zn-ribbon protein